MKTLYTELTKPALLKKYSVVNVDKTGATAELRSLTLYEIDAINLETPVNVSGCLIIAYFSITKAASSLTITIENAGPNFLNCIAKKLSPILNFLLEP